MEGRYRRVVDLVELTDLLQAQGTGISIDEIADRFDVSRRTAERMLRALRERYPELSADVRHGRKYWRFQKHSRTAPFEPAADTWLSARRVAEDMAQRIGEPLDALLAASAEEGASPEVRRQALRMRAMLDRSVELFRVEEPKRETSDVRALVAAVVEAAGPRARQAGVALETIVGDAQPWIEADRVQLTSALLALVENAIEASPSGGRVRLEVLRSVHPGVRRFQVDDEGQGVDPVCRDRIFEPYFTTREEAAGLGLALAQSIARRSGGRVAHQSRPGPGAR
ncbi:MAG: ATP-binding protein, partial [Myxococcota bacterium]